MIDGCEWWKGIKNSVMSHERGVTDISSCVTIYNTVQLKLALSQMPTSCQRMQKCWFCNGLHSYAYCSIAQRYLSNTYSHASTFPPCSVAKSVFSANKHHQMSRDPRVWNYTSTSRIAFCTNSYTSDYSHTKSAYPKCCLPLHDRLLGRVAYHADRCLNSLLSRVKIMQPNYANSLCRQPTCNLLLIGSLYLD